MLSRNGSLLGISRTLSNRCRAITVERTGLVKPTGRLSAATGGRPAELFRVIDGDLSTGEALGLPLPSQR
jgi:hypothetical protein